MRLGADQRRRAGESRLNGAGRVFVVRRPCRVLDSEPLLDFAQGAFHRVGVDLVNVIFFDLAHETSSSSSAASDSWLRIER